MNEAYLSPAGGGGYAGPRGRGWIAQPPVLLAALLLLISVSSVFECLGSGCTGNLEGRETYAVRLTCRSSKQEWQRGPAWSHTGEHATPPSLFRVIPS